MRNIYDIYILKNIKEKIIYVVREKKLLTNRKKKEKSISKVWLRLFNKYFIP